MLILTHFHVILSPLLKIDVNDVGSSNWAGDHVVTEGSPYINRNQFKGYR